MGKQPGRPFSEKHTGFEPDAKLRDAVLNGSKQGEMACAKAADIAGTLGTTMELVGKTVDVLDLRLVKCQLGLFGYGEKKRIVKSLDKVEPGVEAAIRAALAGDRLACKDAWKIASMLGLPKLAIGNACETLGIKIKPCQLGAF